MTASPPTVVPAQRSTLSDAAGAEPMLAHPALLAPQDVRQISADDVVVLPRHIADAAYRVLEAIHALKDNGGSDLFNALGKALGKGVYRPVPVAPAPCEVCHVEIFLGLPHHDECGSDDAVAHRSVILPLLDAED